jgi:hypothetical protein
VSSEIIEVFISQSNVGRLRVARAITVSKESGCLGEKAVNWIVENTQRIIVKDFDIETVPVSISALSTQPFLQKGCSIFGEFPVPSETRYFSVCEEQVATMEL